MLQWLEREENKAAKEEIDCAIRTNIVSRPRSRTVFVLAGPLCALCVGMHRAHAEGHISALKSDLDMAWAQIRSFESMGKSRASMGKSRASRKAEYASGFCHDPAKKEATPEPTEGTDDAKLKHFASSVTGVCIFCSPLLTSSGTQLQTRCAQIMREITGRSD
jgi:hypothetical protein